MRHNSRKACAILGLSLLTHPIPPKDNHVILTEHVGQYFIYYEYEHCARKGFQTVFLFLLFFCMLQRYLFFPSTCSEFFLKQQIHTRPTLSSYIYLCINKAEVHVGVVTSSGKELYVRKEILVFVLPCCHRVSRKTRVVSLFYFVSST